MIKCKKELIFSVDPGKRGAGVACFWKGKLIACDGPVANVGDGIEQYVALAHEVAYVIKQMRPGRVSAAKTALILEQMKARRSRAADLSVTDDLFGLSFMAGAVVPLVAASELRWTPPNWTGGRDKEDNKPRIRKNLDSEELSIVESSLQGVFASHHKEVWDAVGLGLYNLFRL